MNRASYRYAYPAIIHIDNRGKSITGQHWLELSLTNSKRAESWWGWRNLLCWRGVGGWRIRVCAQQKLHQKHTRCMTRVSTSRISELHCCWTFCLRRALGWWTLGPGCNLWSVHNQLFSFLAASGRRKRRGLFPLLRACSVLWGKKEFQGGEEIKRKGSSSHGIGWEGGQRSPCRYETLAMPRNYLRSVVCKGECVNCKDLHHGTGKSSLHLAQMSSFTCQISRVGRSERKIHLSNRKRGCLRWWQGGLLMGKNVLKQWGVWPSTNPTRVCLVLGILLLSIISWVFPSCGDIINTEVFLQVYHLHHLWLRSVPISMLSRQHALRFSSGVIVLSSLHHPLWVFCCLAPTSRQIGCRHSCIGEGSEYCLDLRLPSWVC